jgi:hypothetical protein
MSVEGNQLRKQLADLFDKIAYQLGFGPLPYLPPTFPAKGQVQSLGRQTRAQSLEDKLIFHGNLVLRPPL